MRKPAALGAAGRGGVAAPAGAVAAEAQSPLQRTPSNRALLKLTGGVFGTGRHREQLASLLRRRTLTPSPPSGAAPLSALPVDHVVTFQLKACRSLGAVASFLGKEKVHPFETFTLHLYGTASVYGDAQKGWNRSYDKARQIFASAGTPAIAIAMKSEHAMLFDAAMAITSQSRTGTLRDTHDWAKLFRVGVNDAESQSAFACAGDATVSSDAFRAALRDGDEEAAAAAEAAAADAAQAAAVMNTRRFTWVLRDDALYVTETGKATMKDFMSKHAVLANGALFVRAAGEMLFVRRADVWRTLAEVDAAAAAAAAEAAHPRKLVARVSCASPIFTGVEGLSRAERAASEGRGSGAGAPAPAAAASAAAAPPPPRPGAAAPRLPSQRAPYPDLPTVDDAPFVRADALAMAGFTDPDPARDDELVLVLDNESGTYGPVWFHLSRAAAVLRNCGGGLVVLPLDYHDDLLKRLKSGLCRM